ncbi:MAG: o-succinylbenzoate synthase [Chloroflexi bacterium]|nr:o-succinylbenzoate synthase [Chloroflexota bacterium]MQC19287.1 o-succinylbenzoate synthase [Chloroflexota bacterium]
MTPPAPDVRPVRLRWRPFRLPMRARFEAAHGVMAAREGVLLQLTDDSGRSGSGEASPIPSFGMGTVDDVLALLDAHGAALLGGAVLGAALPEGGPGVSSLRCALDVAALDLRGCIEGRSVASLLGEDAPASWVMANAVIGGGRASEVSTYGTAAQAVGYGVLKLKVGVGTVAEDIRRVAALRDACPEALIRLDANGAWDEVTATEAIEGFAPFGIELLEQPVPAGEIDALARINAAAPYPIAADEAVGDPALLERILEQRAARIIVLKPMVLGGLTAARAVAARAAERGIGTIVTTTFDSSVGTAAAAHLAASLADGPAHGLSTGEHLAADLVARTLVPERGRLAVPQAPGLGIEIDEASLEVVATAPWREMDVR